VELWFIKEKLVIDVCVYFSDSVHRYKEDSLKSLSTRSVYSRNCGPSGDKNLEIIDLKLTFEVFLMTFDPQF